MGFRLLALITICLTAVNSLLWDPIPGCELCLDGNCYEIHKINNRSELWIGDPVAIDKVGNILYYYTGVAIESLNLENENVKTVQDKVYYVTGLAVDQGTSDLYYSSGKDIIKYKPVTNSTEYIHGNVHMKNLYFKDKLYAESTGLHPQLYVVKDSKLELFAPLQNLSISESIMVDKRGDMYFRQGSATHKLAADVDASVLFKDHENFVFSTNNDGVAYFTGANLKLIYRLNYETNELVEVGLFDLIKFGINSAAVSVHFDKHNNVIYVNEYMVLYYLTPNSGHCRVKQVKNSAGEFSPHIQKL